MAPHRTVSARGPNRTITPSPRHSESNSPPAPFRTTFCPCRLFTILYFDKSHRQPSHQRKHSRTTRATTFLFALDTTNSDLFAFDRLTIPTAAADAVATVSVYSSNEPIRPPFTILIYTRSRRHFPRVVTEHTANSKTLTPFHIRTRSSNVGPFVHHVGRACCHHFCSSS